MRQNTSNDWRLASYDVDIKHLHMALNCVSCDWSDKEAVGRMHCCQHPEGGDLYKKDGRTQCRRFKR